MTAREAAILPADAQPVSTPAPEPPRRAEPDLSVKYVAPMKPSKFVTPEPSGTDTSMPYLGNRALLIVILVALCAIVAGLLYGYSTFAQPSTRNVIFGDPNELQYSATAHRTLPPKSKTMLTSAARAIPTRAGEPDRVRPKQASTKKTCADGSNECEEAATMVSSTHETTDKVKVPVSLENHFKKAVYWMRSSNVLSDDDRWAAEALLRQATHGDITDAENDKKHHPHVLTAWLKLKGTKKVNAMAKYVAHIVKVDANWLKSRIMDLYPDDYIVA